MHHQLKPLPEGVAVPFAHLIDRLDRLENKLDLWLYKRRSVTHRPLSEAHDTTERPVEAFDAGVARTLARTLPR